MESYHISKTSVPGSWTIWLVFSLTNWSQSNVMYLLFVLSCLVVQENKCGQIVVTSSVVAEFTPPGKAIYSASKHAVQALIRGLRGELKGTGVKAATILPGAVATEW